MKFNEDTRVKIPAILHCMRLGYEYISVKSQGSDIDESTKMDVLRLAVKKLEMNGYTINYKGDKRQKQIIFNAINEARKI